ncbi:hypothetical protein SNOG_12472 [Parastagonospora nodorum SN15]|uniref:Uncharacterized protein n=1 Tax=Phaeosphaeria nodorum (strain SN15 / ATCC MYA-4574 / FGSC 10173) TaxID=321614 RepID=Q0U6Z2_PHANO|nr:hypothetical protein SNOG_12472 [Parastagonospora nodorum SN15]EAT80285.1 hypothetical protein SNOG_12472 [Parastagonospora nodorum SN15]
MSGTNCQGFEFVSGEETNRENEICKSPTSEAYTLIKFTRSFDCYTSITYIKSIQSVPEVSVVHDRTTRHSPTQSPESRGSFTIYSTPIHVPDNTPNRSATHILYLFGTSQSHTRLSDSTKLAISRCEIHANATRYQYLK